MEALAAIRFRDVRKTFRSGKGTISALKNIDVRIEAGKVTGLIGPDGAGKTTLMRIAAGLMMPDNGQVEVLGINAIKHPLEVQSSVGYMPQNFGLYEDLTVQENLDLYADLQGVTRADRPGRYRELMQMTGLAPFTRRLAGQLSGGMKQKLGLACTLVGTPRLLLLDEPTVGVDPVSRRELWAIVYRQVQERNMTVLLSTAYLDEATRCDTVVLLDAGQLLGEDSPDAFSEPMRSHAFLVAADAINKRVLQNRLADAPGIVDAIIEGEQIRIVTESPGVPDLSGITLNGFDLKIQPVEPTFEDAFVAKLKHDRPVDKTQHAGYVSVSPGIELKNGAIIEVHNLQRRFGNFQAVRNVSFSVQRGEVFGLLGANGAGKTTTFRMLCGLLPLSSGKVKVAGLDMRHASAQARGRLGYMAQRFSLYVNLSVLQNLRFFARAYGLGHARGKQRIDWALETFGLADYVHDSCHELPLGYKQRLAMAAALMHEPDILFLDEPTSGVDPLARRDFWRRINTLAESGVTILVTTHFMDEANYCDRLVIMAEGEILIEGTPAEMKTRYRDAAHPDPTMEDAFIRLIEDHEKSRTEAA